MKNSKLVKIVFVIIMSLAIIIATKNVFAATSLTDGTLSGTTTSGSTTGTGTSASGSSTSTGTGTSTSTSGSGTGSSLISGGTTGTSTTGKETTQNTVLTTTNTSNYNNTSLPKTGVEDSMPVVVLAVVLGISAIYAYKKIQDYKNI